MINWRNHWKPILVGAIGIAGLLVFMSIPSGHKDVALSQEEKAWLQNHPGIRVAINPAYAPFSFLSDEGVYAGIAVDYLRLLEQELNIRFTLVNGDSLATNLKKARQHEVDVVTALKKTPSRSEYLLFTDSHNDVPAVIVVRETLEGRLTVEDLRGLQVAAGEEYAVDTWLQETHPELSLVQVPNDTTALIKLAFGEVDAAVVDLASASYVLRLHGLTNLRVAGALDFSYDLSLAVRNDWPILHGILGKGLSAISAEQRETIRNKWITLQVPSVLVRGELITAIGILLAVVLLLVVAVLVWNRALQRMTAQRTRELAEELAERKRVEERLRLSEQRWMFALEGAGSGVWDWNIATGDVEFSKRWKQMLGYDEHEIDSNLTEWARLLHPDDAIAVKAKLQHYLDDLGNGHYTDEFRMSCKNGDHRWILARGMVVSWDPQGKPQRMVGTHDDITERKEAQQRVEFLAMHDGLTGLPNRRFARERFQHEAALADRTGTKIGLLFLDLDNFKTINDSLGHAIGDKFIIEMAVRLREYVREIDTVNRQGGDEFLITLTRLDDLAAIEKIVQPLLERMHQPCELAGQQMSTSVSIGIAVYPDHGTDFGTLLRKADMALYGAKSMGRNTYCFFDEQMNVEMQEKIYIRNGLAQALLQDEFQLHYQPQVSLTDGSVTGAEALLRWRHPEQGMMSPARFIPTAEESGLIIPIGEWVLREACRQAMAWRRAGMPAMSVAVNLSVVQFMHGDIERTLSDVLDESGLEPEWLELEITESVLISDTQKVLDCVRRIKAMGIRMAIDDFGTGYSSLSYLKRLEVDKLKIDQSFIRGLGDGGTAIVQAIIQMAGSLELTVIAEGVEDEKALRWLQESECDQAQGYYLGHPMPAEKLQDYLEERNPAQAATDK